MAESTIILLPSQDDSRVVVPQPLYTCGGIQEGRDRKSSIPFFTRGRLGVKLPDAANGEFEETDDWDVIVRKEPKYWKLSYSALDYYPSITIRIQVGS